MINENIFIESVLIFNLFHFMAREQKRHHICIFHCLFFYFFGPFSRTPMTQNTNGIKSKMDGHIVMKDLDKYKRQCDAFVLWVNNLYCLYYGCRVIYYYLFNYRERTFWKEHKSIFNVYLENRIWFSFDCLLRNSIKTEMLWG